MPSRAFSLMQAMGPAVCVLHLMNGRSVSAASGVIISVVSSFGPNLASAPIAVVAAHTVSVSDCGRSRSFVECGVDAALVSTALRRV